jgi:hypothetical protein
MLNEGRKIRFISTADAVGIIDAFPLARLRKA